MYTLGKHERTPLSDLLKLQLQEIKTCRFSFWERTCKKSTYNSQPKKIQMSHPLYRPLDNVITQPANSANSKGAAGEKFTLS